MLAHSLTRGWCRDRSIPAIDARTRWRGALAYALRSLCLPDSGMDGVDRPDWLGDWLRPAIDLLLETIVRRDPPHGSRAGSRASHTPRSLAGDVEDLGHTEEAFPGWPLRAGVQASLRQVDDEGRVVDRVIPDDQK